MLGVGRFPLLQGDVLISQDFYSWELLSEQSEHLARLCLVLNLYGWTFMAICSESTQLKLCASQPCAR